MEKDYDCLISYVWQHGVTRELVKYTGTRERQRLIHVEDLAAQRNKDGAS